MGTEHMKVTGIDPRYVSQEESHPVYRVDFWDETRASSLRDRANLLCHRGTAPA